MKVALPPAQFTDREFEHAQEPCPADFTRRTFDLTVGRHIALEM